MEFFQHTVSPWVLYKECTASVQDISNLLLLFVLQNTVNQEKGNILKTHPSQREPSRLRYLLLKLGNCLKTHPKRRALRCHDHHSYPLPSWKPTLPAQGLPPSINLWYHMWEIRLIIYFLGLVQKIPLAAYLSRARSPAHTGQPWTASNNK